MAYNDDKRYYKNGKRYLIVKEWWRFSGVPADGLVYKRKNAMTVFLKKDDFNVKLDIPRLCFLELSKDAICKRIAEDKIGVYNISYYEFISEIFKKLSI